jgi:hypothetical protein
LLKLVIASGAEVLRYYKHKNKGNGNGSRKAKAGSSKDN